MSDKEVMQQALAVVLTQDVTKWTFAVEAAIITALRQAIEQTNKQEPPVLVFVGYMLGYSLQLSDIQVPGAVPVYIIDAVKAQQKG